MCGPALGLIGGLVSGIGSAMGAMQQAASLRAQSALYKRQAAMERDAGSYEAARKSEEARRAAGKQVAGFAANGFGLSGSPGYVLNDTAEQYALDVGAIRYGAAVKSDNLTYQSKIASMNASAAAASAPFAFLSPVLSAASKIGTPFSFGTA